MRRQPLQRRRRLLHPHDQPLLKQGFRHDGDPRVHLLLRAPPDQHGRTQRAHHGVSALHRAAHIDDALPCSDGAFLAIPALDLGRLIDAKGALHELADAPIARRPALLAPGQEAYRPADCPTAPSAHDSDTERLVPLQALIFG